MNNDIRGYLNDIKSCLVQDAEYSVMAFEDEIDIDNLEYLIQMIDWFLLGEVEFDKYTFSQYMEDLTQVFEIQDKLDLLDPIISLGILVNGEIDACEI